jgi:hypothetical protein
VYGGDAFGDEAETAVLLTAKGVVAGFADDPRFRQPKPVVVMDGQGRLIRG